MRGSFFTSKLRLNGGWGNELVIKGEKTKKKLYSTNDIFFKILGPTLPPFPGYVIRKRGFKNFFSTFTRVWVWCYQTLFQSNYPPLSPTLPTQGLPKSFAFLTRAPIPPPPHHRPKNLS